MKFKILENTKTELFEDHLNYFCEDKEVIKIDFNKTFIERQGITVYTAFITYKEKKK